MNKGKFFIIFIWYEEPLKREMKKGAVKQHYIMHYNGNENIVKYLVEYCLYLNEQRLYGKETSIFYACEREWG